VEVQSSVLEGSVVLPTKHIGWQLAHQQGLGGTAEGIVVCKTTVGYLEVFLKTFLNFDWASSKPSTLTRMNDLAEVLSNQGKYRQVPFQSSL
jgi:hypothetical protein